MAGAHALLLALALLPLSRAAAQDEAVEPERRTLTEAVGGGELRWEVRVEADGALTPDGPLSFRDAKGRSRIEGQFKNGLRDGKWRWRDERRKSRVIGHYFRGRRHGEWSFRDDDGDKRAEGNYRKGMRRGKWELWEGGSGDRPTRSVTFEVVEKSNVHGRPVYDGHLLDGAPEGPWRLWWPNGMLQVEAYFSAGQRVGGWRYFHADGSEDPGFAQVDYGRGDAYAGTWVDPPPPAEWGFTGEDPLRSIEPPASTAAALPNLKVGFGAADAAAQRVAKLRLATPDERNELVRELAEMGREALVPVVNGLIELDLADEDQHALAGRLVKSGAAPHRAAGLRLG